MPHLSVSEAVAYADRAIGYKPPSWRKGQAWFIALYAVRPDLADRIRATDHDPYHRDGYLDVARQTVLAMEAA